MLSSSYDSKKSDSTDDSNNAESFGFHEEKFSFPPAPRLCKGGSLSPFSNSCTSDSSLSDGKLIRSRRRGRRKSIKTLPPIGVFWDIENCQVPKTKSATSIVQRIRELFYADYREAEFLVVCDVKKELPQVVQDLNDAQINIIHVSSTSKNAADEKLRQSLRRFSELHRAPAAVALISSDVNFAADLSDLRYRKKINVILVHNANVADALILCANETYNFMSITETIPSVQKRETKAVSIQYADLYIYNLPIKTASEKSLKLRLKILSDNCGGRVLSVNKEVGTAVVRFCSLDIAKRAQKRLLGEDVFGNKIRVADPTPARESPSKNYTGRRVRNTDGLYQVPPIPQMYPHANGGNNFYHGPLWTQEKDANGQSAYNMQTSMFRPIRGAALMETSYNRRSNDVDAAVSLRTNSRTYIEAESKSANGEMVVPVELIVSNLDSSIVLKEIKTILSNMLKQYAMVVNLTITTQADGLPIANVKVASQQEAQLVISQLHHAWLGSKRMAISYAQTSSDPDQLRFMIVSLLQEVPGNHMPLFKFIELVKSRYHCTISLSEVNKLRDVCRISDENGGGRTITLTPRASLSSPMCMNNSFTLYCAVHCPNGLGDRGWGEVDEIILPNVSISLKLFSKKINELLQSHMGCIPLLSLPICYKTEFGESLPVTNCGVPLEHLVTCISNVELSFNEHNKNIKYIKMKSIREKRNDINEEIATNSVSPSLVTNINMLCREVVDLLKTTERCQLLVSRYIPVYHHHFGRQCRVADYGVTKLTDLFEAISHVVQIIGTGSKRTITLTHSAQIRRFTSDLLRVVKVQTSYQVTAQDFPSAYEKVLHKPFQPVEYGLCTLEDLLDEVPSNTVVINRVNNVATIVIPKKEQTLEQIQRTNQFALEVIELLSHSDNCSMIFNKFVPAYHHHFGHQCKVSDYGFTKLVELFEAISQTVDLEGETEVDRRVKLKQHLALKVLGAQIQILTKKITPSNLQVELLSDIYKQTYGCTLKPQAYGCNSIEEVLIKLSDFISIMGSDAGSFIAIKKLDIRTLEVRVWSLLLNPPYSLSIKTFTYNYRIRFLNQLPISTLQTLTNAVSLTSNCNEMSVALTSFYILAAELFHVLFANGGFMAVNAIEATYTRTFGKTIYPREFYMDSFEKLLEKMTFLLVFKGRDNVMLNKKLLDYGINLPTDFNNGLDKQVRKYPWLHSNTYFVRGIIPPKPDTPPPEDWNPSFWNTSPKNDSNLNLSIPFSPIDTSKVFMNTEGLLSPTRSLLSAHLHPLNSIPKIAAPHPLNLPLPDKLILKDESHDSGVNNNSRTEPTLFDSEYLSEPNGQLQQSGSFQTLSTFRM